MDTTGLHAVALSGTTVDWLYDSTSWGDPHSPGETAASKSARVKVMAAPSTRRGRGRQYRTELTPDELGELFGILDSIAGAWESMTAEEKDGDYRYRALRKDAERIRPLTTG